MSSATKTFFHYPTPLGVLTIASDGQAICRIAFGKVALEGVERSSALTNKASNQLLQYLSGRRKSFDLPLSIEGTPFQRCVWEEVAKIPYGKTCTYGDVAAALGNPKATRAVGMANNRNPLPIVIPCHRVIGAGGKITGYAGGIKAKEFLLRLEANGAS